MNALAHVSRDKDMWRAYQVADDDFAVASGLDSGRCWTCCGLGWSGSRLLGHSSSNHGWLSSTARTTRVVSTTASDLIEALVKLGRHSEQEFGSGCSE